MVYAFRDAAEIVTEGFKKDLVRVIAGLSEITGNEFLAKHLFVEVDYISLSEVLHNLEQIMFTKSAISSDIECLKREVLPK